MPMSAADYVSSKGFSTSTNRPSLSENTMSVFGTLSTLASTGELTFVKFDDIIDDFDVFTAKDEESCHNLYNKFARGLSDAPEQ